MGDRGNINKIVDKAIKVVKKGVGSQGGNYERNNNI